MTWGQSKLPLFITKQDIRNIRFISKDGAITYYQRANGSLQFSTNYKVTEVLKLSKHTQYSLHISPNKKMVLVEANSSFHTSPSLRDKRNIYLLNYGDFKSKLVAQGIAISLHGDYDEWFSYYNSLTRTLTLENTLNDKITHSIKLSPKPNPYFVPQVALIDKETLVYTDVDNRGVHGIRTYNLITKKKVTFLKSNGSDKIIKLCLNKPRLYIWESSTNSLSPGTRITYVPTNRLKADQQAFVYQSPNNDLGSLKCTLGNDALYFIKTFKDTSGKYTFDAVKHHLKTEKTQVISDIKFATGLITIDGKLLLPYQGKTYTLLGQNNMTQFDLLKKKGDQK